MGELFKDGKERPATQQELALYEQARDLQATQQVPLLHRRGNDHEYLFFALFDGTRQDATDPRQLRTNIGVLDAQLQELAKDPGARVASHYEKGIGTQTNPVLAYADSALPFTWDDRIESAYRQLSAQTLRWKQDDPDAQVRVAGVGYSRGAVLVPGLARLIDEYGIAHPDNIQFGRDAQGNITVQSPHPPLVPAGEVAQAVGLFDPVATGMPRGYDARLPASAISAFSILAASEQRTSYPHQAILDAERSDDGRFLRVVHPGGHSNIGGGNREAGLEAMSFNAMADYLNGLSDRRLFEHRALPADAAQYSVYQARGVTAVPGLDRDGVRNERLELANCRVVEPCRDAETMDQALAARFEYRTLQPTAPQPAFAPREAELRGATPAPHALTPDDPSHPNHRMLEQIRAGVRSLDAQAGKPWDDASERLSRGLLAASREGDALRSVDHVVLGRDGVYAFAVQGALEDPAHRRAAVDVGNAVRTPVEQSDQQVEAANRAFNQQASRVQEQEQAAVRHAAALPH